MSDELIYVSWGGTGRGAALRSAMERAVESGKGLLYLAVLDDAHFADLESTFLDVVTSELEWLLSAQLELTKTQLGVVDLPVRVLVRGGDVAAEVADVARTIGDTEVIVGAPVPLTGDDTVESLLGQIRDRASVPVSLVDGGVDTWRLSR